jgi:hypothetical protein
MGSNQASYHIVDKAYESVSKSLLLFICDSHSLIPATSLHKKRCPYLGRYTISGLSVDGRQVSAARRKRKCSDEQGVVESGSVDSKADCGIYDFESLVVGCSENSDTMEFYSSCDTETVSGMTFFVFQSKFWLLIFFTTVIPLKASKDNDLEVKRKL